MNKVINNMISGATTPLKDCCSGTKLTKLRCFAIVSAPRNLVRNKTALFASNSIDDRLFVVGAGAVSM